MIYMIFMVCCRHVFRVWKMETYRILHITAMIIDLPDLTRNSKLGMANAMSVIFNLRKWFICPHPQDFPSSHAKTPPSRLRPNALRPGWGEGPPPGDGPPAPSLLAAVLEPWRRSTIMDHNSRISLTHDIIKHSGYYGSWTINKHEKTLPIKNFWKFVSFISWPPNTRMKPSNMIKHGDLRYYQTKSNRHRYSTI